MQSSAESNGQTQSVCNETIKNTKKYEFSLIRALKSGEVIWYAPDHDYGPQSSVFVPFFAVPDAATTAGSYMLVKSAKPAVIPFVPRRRADGDDARRSPPASCRSLQRRGNR